jgi:uncharacterized oxidoreductase
MMQDVITIPASRLNEIAESLLEAGGFTREESSTTARSLILSNLLGHDSHGVVRIAQYINELKKGDLSSSVGLEILKETPNSLQADAQAGLGQVQIPKFLHHLFGKAAQNASVTGALCNSGHVGRVGEWADLIGQKGYAALVLVNDNGAFQLVAPPGGRERRTSTNPLAFAIPLKNGNVFSIDMSTSATAMGNVRLAYLAGEQMEPGLLQDSEGRPTTNPADVIKEPRGALLPMGGAEGYKGFGLSMAIDFLAAGLSGGFTPPAPDKAGPHNNVVVSIWNPAYFAGFNHMADEAEKYIAYLRETTPIDPFRPIRLPGDRANTEKILREQKGIPVSHGTCRLLARSAELTGLPVPQEFKGMIP